MTTHEAEDINATAGHLPAGLTKEQAEKGGEAEGYSIRRSGRHAAQGRVAWCRRRSRSSPERRRVSTRTADRPGTARRVACVCSANSAGQATSSSTRLTGWPETAPTTSRSTWRIRQAGRELVCVSENIDETPSGLLLHGIMSSIAEFYSRNLAAEVIKGTTQKAKNGGTPGRHQLGYRNCRQHGQRPRSPPPSKSTLSVGR